MWIHLIFLLDSASILFFFCCLCGQKRINSPSKKVASGGISNQRRVLNRSW